MKKKWVAVFWVIMACGLHSTGNTFSIDEYRNAVRRDGGKQAIEMYVIGVGQGIFWSSVYNKSIGQGPIFCPPNDLTLTGDIILSVVNSGLKKNAMSGDKPIELFMITEFRRVFPC